MRIKLIVIDNHTLAYLAPNNNYAYPLASSVIKGSARSCPLSAMDSIYLTELNKTRLASAKDFDEFRVSFKGYDNKKEYEYAE